MKQTLPEIKQIILTNMNVNLYINTLTFCKVSMTTDLSGGGSFNYSFFAYFFLNLTAKNMKNRPTFAKLIVKICDYTALSVS